MVAGIINYIGYVTIEKSVRVILLVSLRVCATAHLQRQPRRQRVNRSGSRSSMALALGAGAVTSHSGIPQYRAPKTRHHDAIVRAVSALPVHVHVVLILQKVSPINIKP